MVGIDNFTKYAWGVPTQTREPVYVVNAMQEIFNKIGIPKQAYSDQAGAFTTAEFIR